VKTSLPLRVERLTGEVGARAMTLGRRVVTRETVERCHELGIAVLVWTVNRVDVVRDLDDLGVDGVITDDPRVFGRV
jgi:glycerophosphoryl diester phosphodiesterase